MSKRGENIYLRKDGRYEGRCRIVDDSGQVRFIYIYGKKYRDVRIRLSQIRNEQTEKRERYGDGRFRSWANHYLQDVLRPQVKETTYATYQSMMQTRLIPEFGMLKLEEISDALVNRFYSRMLESGLSASTARATVRLLRAALKDACRKGYAAQTPECDCPRSPAAQPRVLTMAEQDALTRTALREDGLFCMIGLYAGLRVGEICALRWQDWEAECATLCVRGTVNRLPGRGLAIGTPKSETSARRVPVPHLLACLLNRARCDGHADQFIVGGQRSPIDPRTLQRRLDRLCALSGLQGVHMHTLRHSYATRMLEAGTDVKTLSALMGHSSVRITMERYCHTDQERMNSAARRFDQYLSEKMSRQ